MPLFPSDKIRIILLLTVLFSLRCLAQEETTELSVSLENDKFLLLDSTDRHYTHGTILSYWDREGEVPWPARYWEPRLLELVPSLGLDVKTNRYGFLLSQKIYTPTDLNSVAVLTNDRPYAGWLYGGILMQRRGTNFSVPTRDGFEMDLGIVGPSAHAGDTQNLVHRIIHVDPARGWVHQLHDEIAFGVHAQRDWLITRRQSDSLWGWDVIPSTGFDLGTVQVSGFMGGQLRAGFRLPNDFSVFQPRRMGFYGFVGAEGRAVARDLFLDGNTFRDSSHVNSKPFVADVIWGMAWKLCPNLEIAYKYTYRSPEFDGQTGPDRFGSIVIRGMF